MTGADHNKILAIGFAAFAAILFFTFLLLALVSVGVFVGLGITFANESGDPNQAGVGILGALLDADLLWRARTCLCLTSSHGELEDVEAKATGANLGNHCSDRLAANPSARNDAGSLWFVVFLQRTRPQFQLA